MNEQETARSIDALLFVDRMTVRLYDEALPKLDDATSTKLQAFRDDHQRHEQAWRELASKKGRAPEDPREEIKALTEEHARVMRAAQGHDAAIEALLLAERSIAALYDAIESVNPSGEAAQLVKKHHEDERRHVAFVEQHAPALATVAATPTASGERAISCMTGFTDDKNPDDFE